MKKTILSMLFLVTEIGCFAQKSGVIISVTDSIWENIRGILTT